MRTSLRTADLVYPYFVVDGKNKKEVIRNFPGVFRFSIDLLLKDLKGLRRSGIKKILLFGVPQEKDPLGAGAYAPDNVVSRAVKEIKAEFADLVVMTDVCLCAYTTHNHCGVLGPQAAIDNARTLKALARMAQSHAEAGADWVAPSAMARKQVLAIRSALDENGFRHTKILGYSAKFASNFYAPFREVADSAPRCGDRSAYQLDYADTKAAVREVLDDIKEGADMVMVKPALSYLDVIKEISLKFRFSLAAYNVSGEYAFVKYGARQGLWDEKKMVFEILTSIKRAGADLIISYHAKDVAKWLA